MTLIPCHTKTESSESRAFLGGIDYLREGAGKDEGGLVPFKLPETGYAHSLGFSPDNSGTRDMTGPPSQDLTLGWKQPESDNDPRVYDNDTDM